MQKKKKICQYIHYNMAVCGGIFGAYGILNRCDVIGNAQTASLVHLVLDILGKDVRQVMIRLIALLIYMLGTMLTVLIPKYTKWNIRLISIFIDFVAILILMFLPKEMNTVVTLYPIFFAMAFQWNVFADIYGYASSTIFSTNNVRQLTISLTKYICNGEKEEWRRAKFYGGVLLSFHIGVAILYIFERKLGLKSIIVGVFPLLTASLLVMVEAGWINIHLSMDRKTANWRRMEE